MAKVRKAWSVNDTRRLRQMVADHVCSSTIALILGREELSVLMKINHLGLKRDFL